MTDKHNVALPALKAIRKARNLTQQELAQRAKVSRIAIADIERGHRLAANLTLAVAVRLSDVLQVHPRELLYEEKKP